ncbi:MAG: T9SS type A sorting domain-containing protein [Bacteroidia bacterium]
MKTLVACTWSFLLWAQGPPPDEIYSDACGYRAYTHLSSVTDSAPTFSWIAPTPGNTVTLTGIGDDAVVGPFILPKPFVYYWNTYDRVWIGTNGYIAFGQGVNISSVANPYFPLFPTADNKNNIIAPFLADLTFNFETGNPVPNAELSYTIKGDSFIVTFSQVPFWNLGSGPQDDTTGSMTFQVILDPTDSSITFQYLNCRGPVSSSYANGHYMVVGMENITGTSGLQITRNWLPISNYAIKIYHPRNFTCTVTDASLNWVGEPRGGFHLLYGTVMSGSQGEIQNTGNQVISNNIRTILNLLPGGAASPIYHRDTVILTTGLSVGAVAPLNFAKPFSTSILPAPTSDLKYTSFRMRGSLSLIGGGDQFSGNNTYFTEVVVADSLPGGKYVLRYDDQRWDPINAQEGAGGISFPMGVVYLAPENIEVEGISVDALVIDDPTNQYPMIFMVYPYDPVTGAVGSTWLDSLYLDPADFSSGQGIDTFSSGSNLAIVRRFNLPLNAPIALSAGQAVLVSFYIDAPQGASNIANYVVEDLSSPISQRTYEGVGGIWAPYRSQEESDYAVGLIVSRQTTSSLPTYHMPTWKLAAYPNPHPTHIMLHLPAAAPVHLKIADMQGKVVWIQTLPAQAGHQAIQMPDLPSGMYILGAFYQNTQQALRFIK